MTCRQLMTHEGFTLCNISGMRNSIRFGCPFVLLFLARRLTTSFPGPRKCQQNEDTFILWRQFTFADVVMLSICILETKSVSDKLQNKTSPLSARRATGLPPRFATEGWGKMLPPQCVLVLPDPERMGSVFLSDAAHAFCGYWRDCASGGARGNFHRNEPGRQPVRNGKWTWTWIDTENI